jgi:predicted DCC family thiol-disulfide oxidoreductase YuxK
MTRPERPILLYDGECAFCMRTVRWLQKHLPVQPELAPWQGADLLGLGIAEAEASRSVQWIEPFGRVSSGATAVARLLVSNGGRWAVLGRLMLVPPVSWLAAAAYGLVARYRRHLPVPPG